MATYVHYQDRRGKFQVHAEAVVEINVQNLY